VWAQSRQTNRPSLWLIIGLNSMPTMQFGHRMVNIVSVRLGITLHIYGWRRHARYQIRLSRIPLENNEIVGKTCHLEQVPRRHFGTSADASAGQGNRGCPESIRIRNKKRPRSFRPFNATTILRLSVPSSKKVGHAGRRRKSVSVAARANWFRFKAIRSTKIFF
jgi:hypothetical protein